MQFLEVVQRGWILASQAATLYIFYRCFCKEKKTPLKLKNTENKLKNANLTILRKLENLIVAPAKLLVMEIMNTKHQYKLIKLIWSILTAVKFYNKQPFTNALQNICSGKFCKIYRKTSVLAYPLPNCKGKGGQTLVFAKNTPVSINQYKIMTQKPTQQSIEFE